MTKPTPDDQPLDLLSARAGANRPSGFFDKPGVRKFVKNRAGVAALIVIVVFALIAISIILPPHSIGLNAVQSRVGPGDLRGFGMRGDLETRIGYVEFYTDALDRALGSADPEEMLAGLGFAERRVAALSPEELAESLDEAMDTFDLFDEHLIAWEDAIFALEDLADEGGDPGEAAALEEERDDALALANEQLSVLEDQVANLFPQPEGFGGWVYDLRLLAGTDKQGRSISLRAIYSIKTAVQIGMITALFSVVIGAVLGGAAGYFGGMIDHAVVWLYSTLSSIPYIIWLVVIAFVFRESDQTLPFSDKPIGQTLLPVYLAFGVTLWVGTCRVVRGEAMKIKGLDYIQSAISIGAGPVRVLLRHVLPNVSYLLFINFSLAFVAAIKGEVILSFLGLGVQGQPSWGVMIRDSKDAVVQGVFWEIGAATLMMFILVYAFNILSDALQDAFDPKHVG